MGAWIAVNPALSTFSTPSQYLDFGFDTQYQFIGRDIFTINAMYLHENSWNNAANVGTIFSNSHNTLDHFTATASYYYERQYGGMISFGATSGSKDRSRIAPVPNRVEQLSVALGLATVLPTPCGRRSNSTTCRG